MLLDARTARAVYVTIYRPENRLTPLQSSSSLRSDNIALGLVKGLTAFSTRQDSYNPKTMLFTYSAFFLVVLMSSARAAGVGKAWEVSPVQSPDHPASLSPWPRMETSPFEVRSISGVGRLAPSDGHHHHHHHHETIDPQRESSDWDKAEETSRSPDEDQQEDRVAAFAASAVQQRQSRELEDLDSGNVFVPEEVFHDPAIDGFFRKSKEIEDVEALPSLWQKIRSHGRTGRNHGHCSEVEVIDEAHEKSDSESLENNSPSRLEVIDEPHEESNEETISSDHLENKPRSRREVENAEMEKIATSKNVREGRHQSSPESWSKQPLSVEFRHRTSFDATTETDKFARSTDRGFQAPRADFVTANRRSFTEGRESRDLPLAASARSFDEIPTYRNTLRDRDLDAPYSRGLFYPERYRTERDYFVRGLNEPVYPQDRYREADFDAYGRSRAPMAPKPKRIIYYATLPEVVRKPVDLRSYPRPYDTMTRSSTNILPHQDGYYMRRGGSMDTGRYRYQSYPHGSSYDNYDMYPRKPIWNDRPYVPYAERLEEARRREHQDHLDHASMRDASGGNEKATLEMDHDGKMLADRPKSRDQDKTPWPVKIATEVGVKDNERITGRKIFGQRDDYGRFRNNGRMDHDGDTAGNAESRD